MSSVVTITIINEVSCHIKGLKLEHLNQLSEQYAMHTANYFHQVQYKLGVWDGKKRLFHRDGITYVYLLQTLVPKIKKLGYTITFEDRRRYVDIPTNLTINENLFAEYVNDNGDPFIMRNYQISSVNECLKQGGGIIGAGTGAGKAQTLDSLILTTEGWIPMGNITLNHKVITPKNKLAKVTGIFPQPLKDVYLITFHDGSKVKCCNEHLWKVNINNESKILNTHNIRKLLDTNVISIPTVDPIDYRKKHRKLTVDPFIVGVLLSSKRNSTEELRSQSAALKKRGSNCEGIPFVYKYGSIETRKNILKGLSCIDGKFNDTTLTIIMYNPYWVYDIQQIAWSLGCPCSVQIKDCLYEVVIEYKKERRIVSIEQVNSEPTQCISIDDSDHLYITNDFIVTHNTIMSAAITKTYGDVGLRCVTIVPNISLVKQSHDYFKLWELDAGRLDGDVKDLNHIHLVSTWQSLSNVPHILTEYDVIIVDECQTAKAGVLFKLITEYAYNAVIRIGMTGSMPPHPLDNLLVRIALGSIVYDIPVDELQKAEFLSTIDVNIKCLDEQVDVDYFPDYASETDYIRKNNNRNSWVADFAVDKAQQENGNTLLLVTSKPVGTKMLNLIKKKHPTQEVYYLNGDDDVEERSKIYELFKTKQNILVIATVQIAGVGLSIDRIFNLILLDIGKSFTRVVQAIGRGLRRNSKAGKTHCEVHDVCSTLKYSMIHLKERIKTYKKLKYPFNYESISYIINDQIDILEQ